MNKNWIEKRGGYHKSKTSTTKGSADYFARPIPPVRDTMNRPLKDGEVDIAKWVDEVNKGTWKKPG